jgi:hypothetical protein
MIVTELRRMSCYEYFPRLPQAQTYHLIILSFSAMDSDVAMTFEEGMNLCPQLYPA